MRTISRASRVDDVGSGQKRGSTVKILSKCANSVRLYRDKCNLWFPKLSFEMVYVHYDEFYDRGEIRPDVEFTISR